MILFLLHDNMFLHSKCIPCLLLSCFVGFRNEHKVLQIRVLISSTLTVLIYHCTLKMNCFVKYWWKLYIHSKLVDYWDGMNVKSSLLCNIFFSFPFLCLQIWWMFFVFVFCFFYDNIDSLLVLSSIMILKWKVAGDLAEEFIPSHFLIHYKTWENLWNKQDKKKCFKSLNLKAYQILAK